MTNSLRAAINADVDSATMESTDHVISILSNVDESVVGLLTSLVDSRMHTQGFDTA